MGLKGKDHEQTGSEPKLPNPKPKDIRELTNKTVHLLIKIFPRSKSAGSKSSIYIFFLLF